MQHLTEEIHSFSRSRLRKQCTIVTLLSGRRIIETWKGARLTVVEDPASKEGSLGPGYVPDTSWDLQVGLVKPYLLLGSQDSAHDFATLSKYKVSHILNVAYVVENAFPDLFIYRNLSILDQPDIDITSYIKDCNAFIKQAYNEKGVVFVHCNTGVSRAAAVVIGYLMSCDGHAFDAAFSLVKKARPASCPNPGFVEQLRDYRPTATHNGNKH